MFAPHCPTCGTRVLLGVRRLVAFSWTEAGERRVQLRCVCGTLVDACDEEGHGGAAAGERRSDPVAAVVA